MGGDDLDDMDGGPSQEDLIAACEAFDAHSEAPGRRAAARNAVALDGGGNVLVVEPADADAAFAAYRGGTNANGSFCNQYGACVRRADTLLRPCCM